MAFPNFRARQPGLGHYVKDDPREASIEDVALNAAKLGCPQ